MGKIKQAPDVAAEVFDSSWSTDAAGQLHSDVQQYLAEKQTQYVSHSEETYIHPDTRCQRQSIHSLVL